METNTETSRSASTAPGQLLPPTQALAQLELPRDVLAQTSERRVEERARYGFQSGGMGFLIAADTISEVVAPSGIAPLPRSAAWLLGIINLRGHPVPVFDLSLALELSSKGPGAPAIEKPMVLVLDKGADALGLLIEGFPLALRALRPAQAAVPLPPRLSPFAHGLRTNDAGIWVEFDHKELFRSLAEIGLRG